MLPASRGSVTAALHRRCHRHSSAQMMHCLRSQDYYYTLAFMMLETVRKKTIMVQGSGTWQPWHISSKSNPKTSKRQGWCICSRSASPRHQEPFSHACRPRVKPFRGILITERFNQNPQQKIHHRLLTLHYISAQRSQLFHQRGGF